jgi:hypothetical protein
VAQGEPIPALRKRPERILNESCGGVALERARLLQCLSHQSQFARMVTAERGAASDPCSTLQEARAKAIDMTLSSSAPGKSKSIGSWRVVAISTINSSMDAVGRPVLTPCRIINASLWTGIGVDFGRSSINLLIFDQNVCVNVLGQLAHGLSPCRTKRSAKGVSLEESSVRS